MSIYDALRTIASRVTFVNETDRNEVFRAIDVFEADNTPTDEDAPEPEVVASAIPGLDGAPVVPVQPAV